MRASSQCPCEAPEYFRSGKQCTGDTRTPSPSTKSPELASPTSGQTELLGLRMWHTRTQCHFHDILPEMQGLNPIRREHHAHPNWETLYQTIGLYASNTSTQRNSRTWHLIQTEGDHRNIQLSAMRDHGLDPGQMATAEHELWIRGIDVHFPDFDQCRMILRENFLVFKKSALKYLGVKGHTVSNLLSNGSEKYISIRICVCVCAWVCKENMIKQMH